jgi:hypothetical protein
MKKANLLFPATAALLVIVLSGLIYVAVQQSYRSAANDPQLQLAKDISDRLKNNQSIDQLMGGDTVDISKSLAVFKVLYNAQGMPVHSSGLLDGGPPQMPAGVFDFTKRNGEDVLTWQLRRGLRMAMVVEFVQSPGIAFVAVGRSLREVEKRVSILTIMLFIGLLACFGIILVHQLITYFRNKNQ